MNEELNLNLIVQLREIHCDSKIGKSRHFIAADRKAKYHKRIGLAVIVISVFIGSTVIKLITNDALRDLTLAISGFLAASLAAMQTFFNYSKEIENHRKTGNLYLEITRDCDNIISKYNDGFIVKEQCQHEFEKVLERYKKTNKEEEVCPNSDSDYQKAYKRNKKTKESLRELKNKTIYRAKEHTAH